jgi:hypothetical protein
MVGVPGPFYALYLQATRKNEASHKVMRKQWVVVPPMTDTVLAAAAGGGTLGPDARFLQFFREQSSPENRVKWRFVKQHHDVMKTVFPAEVKRLQDSNLNLEPDHQWDVSPIITCQVSAREIVDLFQDPETPYALLRRFEKVARTRHNLAI